MKTLELTLISFLALVISPATAAPGLTLSEALRAAMRQNPDITSARHRQDAAEWGRSAARGAFLPKIVAEGSWTQLDPVPTREITLPLPAPLGGPQTREIELGDEETKKISAVITQNVFASGADWFSWRAASAGAEAARFGAEATRQNTALECARVFGLVLLAEAQERAFANMVTMKERTFLEINSGFRVGRASELDRLKAESALETVRADWNQAKARVAQARMNLSRLMGRPLEDQEKIEGQLDIQHSEASSEVMTSDPVSTNPQWRALELLADQKVAQAREATARHLPSVTIGARRDWATPFASQDEWGETTTMFAQASWLLFDGLTQRSRVGALGAEAAETRSRGESLKESLRLASRSASLNAHAAIERHRAMSRSVELATKAREIARVGHSAGTVTTAGVLEADAALLQAELALLQTSYDFNVARWEGLTVSGQIISTLLGKETPQ